MRTTMPYIDQAGRPRRSNRNFSYLRSTFSRSTQPITELEQRPEQKLQAKPADVDTKPLPVLPDAPMATPDRRQNRMSLFDMFSKPRVERARGYGNEAGLEPLPERSETPAPALFDVKPENSQQTTLQPIAQSPPAPRTSASIGDSQRPAQIKSPRTTIDDWDPPPLFQAYPQSVRHGTLLGTNLSADSIRGHQLRRQNAGLFGSTTTLPLVREGLEDELSQREQSWQSLGLIPTLDGPELVSKVFVLVTAGRLVQYAGDGNYDRMPEKVLQLGEKSAAFACDLIPGKHFVIQVVQSVNDEGIATINKSRSLLSRLRMPSAALRKMTSSFLLILSTPEEMDFWLKAIRKVINQLSGKGGKGESGGKHSRKNTAEKVDELPTHRFQAQKASLEGRQSLTRSSSPHSQARSSFHPSSVLPLATSTTGSTHSTEDISPRNSASDTDGNSSHPHRGTSTEASSLVTTPASIDQTRVDQLREGSRYRDSLMSIRTSHTYATDTITIPTSRNSSSPPSPHVESFAVQQPSPPHPPPIRTSYIQPMANTCSYRRSMQATPVEESERVVRIPRHSPTDVYGQISPAPYTKATPISATASDNPRSRGSVLYPRVVPNRQQNSEYEPRARAHRPESTVGQLPNISNRSMSRIDQPRRQLFRPVPIRPSEPSSNAQGRTSETYVPRRFSSLPASPAFPTAPTVLPANRPRAPSYSLTPLIHPQAPPPFAPQAKRLQRPTSLQIRSDPAPFLSQSRKRQPSFSRSTSASPAPLYSPPATAPLNPPPAPPIPPMNLSRPGLSSRTSLIPGLPPPAPPPSCPLPAPPPQAAA